MSPLSTHNGVVRIGTSREGVAPSNSDSDAVALFGISSAGGFECHVRDGTKCVTECRQKLYSAILETGSVTRGDAVAEQAVCRRQRRNWPDSAEPRPQKEYRLLRFLVGAARCCL